MYKHLNETIQKQDIQNIEEDIRTFLKNVNRLKIADDYFELISYWDNWIKNIFNPFIDNLTGRGNRNYKEDLIDNFTKQLNRLIDSIDKLFIVTELNIEHYKKKIVKNTHSDEFINFDNNFSIIVDYIYSGTSSFEYYISNNPSKNTIKELKQLYFNIWQDNSNSRYISTKKVVDDVFDLLYKILNAFEEKNINGFVEKHIDEWITIEGIKVHLLYDESRIDNVYTIIKKLESCFSIIKNQEIGFLLKNIKFTIDYLISTSNIKTLYSQSEYSAGVYRPSENEIVLQSDSIDDYYVFDIVYHELGHSFYFTQMNKNEREEWKEYYNMLMNNKGIQIYINNPEYKSMIKDFDDINKLYWDIYKKPGSILIQSIKDVFTYYILDIVNKYKNLFMFDCFYSIADTKNGLEYAIEKVTKEVKKDIKNNNYYLIDDMFKDSGDPSVISQKGFEIIINDFIKFLYFQVDLEIKNEQYNLISNFPTAYASTNDKEFFAEVFCYLYLRHINITNYKNYSVTDTMHDVFSKVTQLKESIEVKLVNKVNDAHGDQLYCELTAYDTNNNIIGYVNYYTYYEEVHIGMIQVQSTLKSQGIGSQLIEWLIKEYGYQNIWWGMTTKEGSILKKKFDNKYGERQEVYNNLTVEVIDKVKGKDRKLGDILEDFFSIGYEKTYDKLFKRDKEYTIKNHDVIEFLGDMSEWILKSISNNHSPHDFTPDYILDDLYKWFKIKID